MSYQLAMRQIQTFTSDVESSSARDDSAQDFNIKEYSEEIDLPTRDTALLVSN